jgi:hypothetical protein
MRSPSKPRAWDQDQAQDLAQGPQAPPGARDLFRADSGYGPPFPIDPRPLLANLVAFEATDWLVEVRPRWLDGVTLWWVPTEAHRAPLLAEGVAPGRIWTALELVRLLSAMELRLDRQDLIDRAAAIRRAREGLELAVRVKLLFNGAVSGS